MKSVTERGGRTVLFVSHNMEAVQNLCSHALLMENGQLDQVGKVQDVVAHYMKGITNAKTRVIYAEHNAPVMNSISLRRALVAHNEAGDESMYINNPFRFEFTFDYMEIEKAQLDITFHLVDERNILVYVGSTVWTHHEVFEAQTIHAVCHFPGNLLNEGTYTICKLLVVRNKGTIIAEFDDVLTFNLLPEKNSGHFGWVGKKEGILKLKSVEWQLDTVTA